MEEKKLTLKERAQKFGEKHPKIAKVAKVIGLVSIGAAAGAVGVAVAKSKGEEADVVEGLLETTGDILDNSLDE